MMIEFSAFLGITLFFLLNLFAHELAHIFVAKRKGFKVRSFKFFTFRFFKDGKKINFIDEMMHPFKFEWSTREYLLQHTWPIYKAGYERGKDYNHSSFIDLIIRGLCGVDVNADVLTVKPRVKGIWKWFKLEIPFKNKLYNIYYDEDGTYFNKGKGITIELVK